MKIYGTTPDGEEDTPLPAADAAAVAAAAELQADMDGGAFEKGIAAAKGTDSIDDDDIPAPGDKPAAAKPISKKDPDENPPEGEEGDEVEEEEEIEEAEETDEQATARVAAENKAADDKEMAALGITHPKTQARFRELSDKARQYDEVATRFTDLQARAETAFGLQEMIVDTGARPESVGATIGYLKAINGNDIGIKRQALVQIEKEAAWLRGELGLPAIGTDPLDDPINAELKAEVESGEMPEKRARELAVKAIEDAANERQSKKGQDQQAVQEAYNKAAEDTLAWGKLQRKADGDQVYLAKMEIAGPAIKVLQASTPPHLFPAAVRKLYDETKLPVPKKKVPIVSSPTRPMRVPGGGSKPIVDVKTADNGDAFMMGVEAAKAKRT